MPTALAASRCGSCAAAAPGPTWSRSGGDANRSVTLDNRIVSLSYEAEAGRPPDPLSLFTGCRAGQVRTNDGRGLCARRSARLRAGDRRDLLLVRDRTCGRSWSPSGSHRLCLTADGLPLRISRPAIASLIANLHRDRAQRAAAPRRCAAMIARARRGAFDWARWGNPARRPELARLPASAAPWPKGGRGEALMLVTELIRRGALYHGDRTAILFGDEQHELPRRSTGSRTGSPMRSAARSASPRAARSPCCSTTASIRCPAISAASRRGWCARRSTAGCRSTSIEAMIEKIGAAHADLRPEPGRARRRAQGGACRTSPSTGSATTSVGPDLLRAGATTRRTPIPRLADRAGRRHPGACSPRARPARSRPSQHTQATYGAVVHNVLSNLIDPRPGEIMLHAASMIHASGRFVLPYWLRGGDGGDPARLRARLLCRGDRALAAERAQPRADHAADAVPAAGHRGGRSLLGRDDRLRRLADAAAGARAGARPVGPGLRPILRPDRSAARHLPR